MLRYISTYLRWEVDIDPQRFAIESDSDSEERPPHRPQEPARNARVDQIPQGDSRSTVIPVHQVQANRHVIDLVDDEDPQLLTPNQPERGNTEIDGQVRLVGGRRRCKMRGKDVHIAWFESVGTAAIREPPTRPPPASLEVYDLFIHRVPVKDDVQVWRWESHGGVLLWMPLTPGRKVKVPGLERRRILVITEQGKPSYVTGGTVERRYNDRYN